MRTAEEIRARHLDILALCLKRPRMFVTNAVCLEMFLMSLIGDIRFIEEQSLDWAAAISDNYTLGCRGVAGKLIMQEYPFPDYISEVASAYAEAASVLGYFTPARFLPPDEMSRLRRAINSEFKARDWDERELHERFGPPSHEVFGGETTVACYATSKPRVKWICFDLARRLPGNKDLLKGWLHNPLLRDVRMDVRNKMHLSPLGKRWKNGELG